MQKVVANSIILELNMGYIVSQNKPNKLCKVHYSNCTSIKQVIGDKETTNQNYSDILNTCDDVKKYLNEMDALIECSCCKKCNPDCC